MDLSDKANMLEHQLAQALARAAKFEKALRELDGFAARNVERAKKAAEAAKQDARIRPSENRLIAQAECNARFHDANRFHLVISERVKEALAP